MCNIIMHELYSCCIKLHYWVTLKTLCRSASNISICSLDVDVRVIFYGWDSETFVPAVCSTGNMILLILSCEAALNCFSALSVFFFFSTTKQEVLSSSAVVRSCCSIISWRIEAWKRGQWSCFTPALTTHKTL